MHTSKIHRAPIAAVLVLFVLCGSILSSDAAAYENTGQEGAEKIVTALEIGTAVCLFIAAISYSRDSGDPKTEADTGNDDVESAISMNRGPAARVGADGCPASTTEPAHGSLRPMCGIGGASAVVGVRLGF